ncbi:MAG: hypothetical protein KAW09_06325, partial [Thermoplasmata archaeon]|nr:hypothetical protein [Thermoplasmata archaeon]
YYTKKITDLEDELRERIDELERELQRLRKELRDTLPPVYVNETGLPTIPRDSRGRGSTDDNMVWLDPFRTTVYSVAHFDSGSDLDFHLPYPTSAEEVSILSDDLWIAEKSYSTLFVNDTDGNEILNTTDPVTYYGGLEGQNITIQTSGASSSVRADRVTVVRLIDSFSWGESLSSGYFAVTSKTENEISYNQECIRVYWAFPESDSEGRAIQIDGSSIRVQDKDSSLYLDRGRHFEATEIGGVSLELRWLNTSTSRTFRIEFTRASHVETTEYYVIHDTEISISDTYPGSSYTANVHISQSGTANFEGMIVVKFLLTGMYADRQLDPHTLIIKRSDQSGSTEFWYDSVSRELRLTDISIDAGDSITFSLFWDWAGPTTPIVSLLVAEPLIVYSLILLTGFLGLLAFTDEKNVKSWKRWAGLAGIIAAIIAVLLLASGVGSVAAMLIVPGWGG